MAVYQVSTLPVVLVFHMSTWFESQLLHFQSSSLILRGKVEEDGPRLWDSIATWKTKKELLAPGFALAQH